MIRDCRIHSILDKCSKGESISSIISNVRPFGVRGYLFNNPERYPDSNLQDRPFPGSIKAYGVKGIKGGAKRTIGYISPSIVTDNIQAIDMYKLYFTTSYSTNAINPPEVIIGEPGSMCTETFLLVGPFKTEKEQVSCYSYMQTKLFKFLLYYGKGTMHVTKSVFALIPLQTFDHLFTDVELFKKYDLDKDEIKFIENLLETKD